MKLNKDKKIILIILVSLFITIIIYWLELFNSQYSRIFRYFYFIPITLSSYYFGLSIGVFTSVIITILYVPSVAISFQVGKINFELIFTIILFNLISVIIGYYSNNIITKDTNSRFIYQINKMINEIGLDKHKLLDSITNFFIENFQVTSIFITLDEVLINKNFGDNLMSILKDCSSSIQLPRSKMLETNILTVPINTNNYTNGYIGIGYAEETFDYKNLLHLTAKQLSQAIVKINLFEEKLKFKNYQKMVVENLSIGVVVIDKENRITLMNKEAKRIIDTNNLPINITFADLKNENIIIILEDLTNKKKLEELEELNKIKSELIKIKHTEVKEALDRIIELTAEEKEIDINEVYKENIKLLKLIDELRTPD